MTREPPQHMRGREHASHVLRGVHIAASTAVWLEMLLSCVAKRRLIMMQRLDATVDDATDKGAHRYCEQRGGREECVDGVAWMIVNARHERRWDGVGGATRSGRPEAPRGDR